MSNQDQLLHEEENNQKKNKQIELNGAAVTFNNKIEMQKEAQNRDFNQVRFETSQQAAAHLAKKIKDDIQQAREHIEQKLVIKDKLYTQNVMKADMINTVKKLYGAMDISEMKFVNVDNDGEKENLGAALG